MNQVLDRMLESYACRTRDDHTNALREIVQQIALLGLWRSKFFQHAAFYGGTALRILYGLDRYSEDLDFSLLKTDTGFSLEDYGKALRSELEGFGFEFEFQRRPRGAGSAIEAAFLKGNIARQLITVRAGAELRKAMHAEAVLKIRLEVDTEPPGGFEVQSRVVLLPVPFAVIAFSLPDLFASKVHALLCRRWKSRVKGRDWYDLVWYLGHYPRLRLSHLEVRMRHSGDWTADAQMTKDDLFARLEAAIGALDVRQARQEVERYVKDKSSLELWSRDFFVQIIDRIEII